MKILQRQGRVISGLKAAFLFLIAVTGGCRDPLKDAINVTFPPIVPIQNQLAATEAAARHIALIANPNIYAAVSKDDLASRLPETLAASLNEDGSQRIEASDIEVALGNQEAIIRADFDIAFDNLKSRALGTAEVHCAIAIENSAIVLRPAATGLKLSKLKYNGKDTAAVLAPLINRALQPFLANLNGAIEAQAIPLSIHYDRTIDLRSEIQEQFNKASQKDAVRGATLSNLNAPKVFVRVALGRASVLVDPEAVHVLGEIVSLNPDLQSRTLAELRAMADAGSAGPFSSAQIAYLAGCPIKPDDPELPSLDSLLTTEYRSVCRALQPKTLVTDPTPRGNDIAQTQEKFAAAFPAFQAAFQAKTAMVEKPERLHWKETAIAISRPAFAQIFNDALQQITITANLSLPDFKGDFKETIYTDPAPDLKCTQNAGGCDSDFTYPGYNPRGCESDCGTRNCGCVLGICGCVNGVDLNCVTRKGDCERLKAQEKLTYDVAKTAAQTEWSVRKAACELAKEAKKKGCEINQGWLNAVGNMDVGEVRGSWSARDPRAQIYLGGLSLAPAFTGLKARLIASGSTGVTAQFRVTPHNAGTIACFKEFDGSLSANASMAQQNLDLGTSLTGVESVGDELRFKFLTTENTLRVNTEPPPLVALFTQNADKLVTSCPVPATVAAGIAGAAAGITPVNILAAINIAKT